MRGRIRSGKEQMVMITPIDLDKWPRNYHYKYYTEALQVGYSVTIKVDVTEVLAYSRAAGRSFYGCMIYAISAAVNRLACMKMVKMEDGNPGIWDRVHPVFTVFHKESETFSDLWTSWDPDFETFYTEYERVVDRYGNCRGIKGREHQPANFFCVSCSPWLDFIAYAPSSPGPAQLFPIIAYGKYTEADGRVTVPLSVTISHAAADGYHISKFAAVLREETESFGSRTYPEK